ncbi:uncharacterized protein VTP21DRAFT_10632 [Calcarisporiella thermophila]|uniref:uncharacterized protein n=1 Tax=Calcarisporiella thermophila TaxID=911321 RepID=UPI0037430A60
MQKKKSPHAVGKTRSLKSESHFSKRGSARFHRRLLDSGWVALAQKGSIDKGTPRVHGLNCSISRDKPQQVQLSPESHLLFSELIEARRGMMRDGGAAVIRAGQDIPNATLRMTHSPLRELHMLADIEKSHGREVRSLTEGNMHWGTPNQPNRAAQRQAAGDRGIHRTRPEPKA